MRIERLESRVRLEQVSAVEFRLNLLPLFVIQLRGFGMAMLQGCFAHLFKAFEGEQQSDAGEAGYVMQLCGRVTH